MNTYTCITNIFHIFTFFADRGCLAIQNVTLPSFSTFFNASRLRALLWVMIFRPASKIQIFVRDKSRTIRILNDIQICINFMHQTRPQVLISNLFLPNTIVYSSSDCCIYIIWHFINFPFVRLFVSFFIYLFGMYYPEQMYIVCPKRNYIE